METFEAVALEHGDLKPKTWLKYDNDTFIVWLHGKATFPTILDFLNSQHSGITLGRRLEQRVSYPFWKFWLLVFKMVT